MTADGTQNYAKGVDPGIRELQVLKGYGNNAIVASICPKNTTPAKGDNNVLTDANYGYNPAVAAIIERLKEALTVKCLPRPLDSGHELCTPEVTTDCTTVAADVGKVPCAVVEVRPEPQSMPSVYDGGCPDSDSSDMLPGRQDLANGNERQNRSRREGIPEEHRLLRAPAIGQFRAATTSATAEIDPVHGATCCPTARQKTRTTTTSRISRSARPPGRTRGPCTATATSITDAETDPMIVMGAEAPLVKDCKSSDRRILRFLGQNLPAKDGLAFIACIGGAASVPTEPARERRLSPGSAAVSTFSAASS